MLTVLNEQQGRSSDATRDYERLWCRESECCPGRSLFYGLFFETGGMKKGHLLTVYEGDSCDSLGISYQTVMKKWKGSEYVLSNSAHRFVVNGALN